jgi:aspartate kinase
MPEDSTVVMKFGGASLASPEHFDHIADRIIQRAQSAKKLVIVVSAMGKTTDELIKLARSVNPNPPQREYDMLLTVGERISMALLAMALAKKGYSAQSLTGSQSGIMTCSNHTAAHIVEVRPKRILASLQKGNIVIVAGFQGVSLGGEITTLGRGGSDSTAVALGIALDASQVEFYKDVPGVFSKDPKIHPDAKLLPELSYDLAIDLTGKGAKVLHQRAVIMAKRHGIPLSIQPFDVSLGGGTTISEERARPEVKLYEQGSFSSCTSCSSG